jgi:hypothetical protein
LHSIRLSQASLSRLTSSKYLLNGISRGREHREHRLLTNLASSSTVTWSPASKACLRRNSSERSCAALQTLGCRFLSLICERSSIRRADTLTAMTIRSVGLKSTM